MNKVNMIFTDNKIIYEDGRIFNLDETIEFTITKPNKNSSLEYPVFTFVDKNGNKRTEKAHRLVYMSFNRIEEIDSGYVIDHIDMNKNNYNLNNLRLIII